MEQETKRDRVRRLVLTPLAEAGFRFPRGTSDDAGKRDLDRLADGLGYLPDDKLDALRVSLMTKGQGTARCFWPSYASVIGLAEAFHPRPLTEVPEILRWFKSAAGSAALQGGRLVAEYRFWERKKRPPVSDQDRRRVAEVAADWQRRAALTRERLADGRGVAQDDQAWLNWYEKTEAMLRAMVDGVEA